MNIGVDIRCLETPHRTGVGEYTFELLSEIFKNDRENRYFLFSNSFTKHSGSATFNYPNVNFANFKIPNKLFNLLTLCTGWPKIDRLICKRFKLTKLDYFFSPNLNFISLSGEIRHILTIHDLTYELFPDFLTSKQLFWHRLTRPQKQCQNAFKLITPSENTMRDLMTNYRVNEDKTKTIYPGLSSGFTSENSIGNTDKYKLPDEYIFFLGTKEPRKNLKNLILGFNDAAKKIPPKIILVIAGAPGWKNKDVENVLKSSPVKDRIKFIGYVDDSEKISLYKKARLFVYPSFYEGFGFPVLEAMASGVPVITSNRSSLPEITNGAAYLVNPHRPNEISDGIVKIFASDSYRNNLIQKGQIEAAKYSWHKAALDWLKIISA